MIEKKATVEDVYGDALYMAAKERGIRESVSEELSDIERVFDENPELFALLRSHIATAAEKRYVVRDLFGGAIAREVLNFLYVLIDRGRLSSFSGIRKTYERFIRDEDKTMLGTLVTAQKISDEQLAKIETKTSKVFGADVGLRQRVNEELIGGAQIYMNGRLIDMSIRSQIERLKEELL
jgi:F-type H+-transporting ATPase subunit delta